MLFLSAYIFKKVTLFYFVDAVKDVDEHVENTAEAADNDEACETIFIECEESAVLDETWSTWKSANLKQSLSAPLKQKINATPISENAQHSRRRPVAAAALQSTNLSKVYSQLAEKRLEVSELEHQIILNKEKRDKEKHDIEKKILEVQLQIKLEELKKLNPDWVNNFFNKNNL